MAKMLLPLLSLLALVAPALAHPHPGAVGYASVVNTCNIPAVLQPVGPGWTGDVWTLQPGESYSSHYIPDTAGISIKIWAHKKVDQGNHEQFEYYYNKAQGKVLYNLSFVNGNPFGHIMLYPEEDCRNGRDRDQQIIDTPQEVFWTPTDNWAVQSCAADVDITRYLCG